MYLNNQSLDQQYQKLTQCSGSAVELGLNSICFNYLAVGSIRDASKSITQEVFYGIMQRSNPSKQVTTVQFPKQMLNYSLCLEWDPTQLIPNATFKSLNAESQAKCAHVNRDCTTGTGRLIFNKLIQFWEPKPLGKINRAAEYLTFDSYLPLAPHTGITYTCPQESDSIHTFCTL